MLQEEHENVTSYQWRPPLRAHVTIEKVAAQAGVSLATVSRVLNNPQTVSLDKRRRVEEAIAALGYFPQGAAQALRSRRSMTVGAVFPRLNSMLFGSFFNEMHERLDEAGFMFTVSTTGYRLDNEAGRVRQLLARGIDALVMVGNAHSQETDRLIALHAVPRINVWAWDEESRLHQIGFSNRDAMEKITQYVCRLGHSRIAMISATTTDNDRAEERRKGFVQAMAMAGLSVDPDLIIETPFGIDEGGEAFLRLCNRPLRPTAVVCSSDIFAFGALRQARRLGLRVPRDISITGFDDTDFAELSVPSLTTVRTPRRLMATRCAQSLIAHLSGEIAISSVQLPCELIERESAGPPPDRREL